MATTESLVARLDECGLLLQHDYALPSLVTIVVGEPVRGSWWSHPRAHAIFECLNDLTAHPDVLTAKLVSGKVTLIHRRLWPALLAVASAHEPWQFAGLPAAARDLYQSVELYGMLMAPGRNAKQLEQRLLVHSAQVHTEAGRHETRLERWSLWAERSGCQNLPAANEGQRQIEVATLGLGGAVRLLPWHRARPI
jgi:hypothetical protein